MAETGTANVAPPAAEETPSTPLVSIIDSRGNVGTVPQENLQEAIAHGYRVLSPEENRQAYLQEQYGDAPAQTFLESAASGATLGISDVALGALGNREGLRERRARNPIAATTGDIFGIAAPALISGGAALAERAGIEGIAAGIAKGTATIAEHAPAALVPAIGEMAAESAGGSLLKRAVTRAATEGAVYGAGQATGELALSDEPLTIETAASTLGRDVLFGVLAGGAIGAAGAGVSRAIETAAPLLRRMGESVAGKIGTQETLLSSVPGDILKSVASHEAAGSPAYSALKREADSIAAELGGQEKNFKGLRNTLVTIIKEKADQGEKIYQDILKAAEKSSRIETPEVKELLQNIQNARAEVQELYPIHKIKNEWKVTLPDQEITQRFTQPETVNKLLEYRDNLAKGLETFKEWQTGKTGKVRDWYQWPIEEFEKHGFGLRNPVGNLSAEELAQKQTRLKELQDALKSNSPEKLAALKAQQVIADMERHGVTVTPERLAEATDGLPVQPGSEAETLSRASIYKEMAQAALEQRKSHVGLAGKVLGGTAGAMLGHPWVGYGIGREVLGSSQAMTKVMGALGTLIEKTSKGISSGAESFIKSGSQAAGRAMTRTALSAKRFTQMADNVSMAAGNPQETAIRIHQQAAALHAINPQMADKAEMVANKRIQFLYDKMPKNPGIGMAIGKKNTLWAPSDAEIGKWFRYIEAATNPMQIVEELKSNRLSPETVEAAKTLYPETYQRIQTALVDQVTTLRKTLPYRQRLQLSIFFNVPVDSTMRPEFIQSLQANFAPPEKSHGAGTTSNSTPGMAKLMPPKPTKAQQLGG